jgi:type IV pilus assembly protein PilW
MRDQAAKRRVRRAKPTAGLALVELMVALTIALFLIGGMAILFQNVRNTYTEQQGLSQLQDNARLAMTLMTDVIQSAGYFPDPTTYSAATTLPISPSFTAAGTPVIIGSTSAPGDSVTVRYAPDTSQDLYNCMGGTNTVAPYDTWENTFSVVSTGASSAGLYCTFWSAASGAQKPVELVSGLTNGTGTWPQGMILEYGVTTQADSSGTCLDTYKTQAQMTAADWANVCSVKVTLNFVNPVPTPGQNNSSISYAIVIPIMNAAGGTS